MKQIDLDDLPPRVAQILIGLADGEVLGLVRGGALVARLKVSQPAARTDPSADLPPDEAMEEVLDHFKSMIEEEF